MKQQTPPTSTEYEKMPEWDAVKYTNWRNWAKSCYDAGRKNINQELAKALQDMIEWADKYGFWIVDKEVDKLANQATENAKQVLKQAGLKE